MREIGCERERESGREREREKNKITRECVVASLCRTRLPMSSRLEVFALANRRNELKCCSCNRERTANTNLDRADDM